jgi:hypothetical protein
MFRSRKNTKKREREEEEDKGEEDFGSLYMALNYHPSSPFLVGGDDCAAAAMLRGCGCWSEEASPLSSVGANPLWWDSDSDSGQEEEDCDDPAQNLPTDPFGMNLESTLTAALASCIRFGNRDAAAGGGAVCAHLSFYLNQALALSWEPHIGGGCRSASEAPFGRGGAACSQRLPPLASGEEPVAPEDEPSTSGNAALMMCHDTADVEEGGAPPDAMVFALRYLGLRDLLAVEMVCKSLHSAVRGDHTLWKCIHVEPVLSGKISDPDVLRLTQKIPGVLQCLNIDDCLNITDKGLNAVLQSNPKLIKVSVSSHNPLAVFSNISSSH